jgi:hypothetical protein
MELYQYEHKWVSCVNKVTPMLEMVQMLSIFFFFFSKNNGKV